MVPREWDSREAATKGVAVHKLFEAMRSVAVVEHAAVELTTVARLAVVAIKSHPRAARSDRLP